MPKKNRVTPYWNFVKFYQRSRRASGVNISLEEANRDAGQIWANMADHEKEVFVEANQLIQQQRAESSGACAREPPRQQRSRDANRNKRDLKLLGKKDLDYTATIQNFAQHVFCLAHVRPMEGRFVVGEITVARWSVEKGIITYFHAVCDPQISGDEYKTFRRTVGDREAIVRILNTSNSDDNRRRLQDALLKFCDGAPLLVQTGNHEAAGKSMEHLAFFGPVFNVLRAEEVFQILSQRMQNFPLTKDCISRAFGRLQGDCQVQHLKCNLHRELRQYTCSLELCLSMAYALEEIFADRCGIVRKLISHQISPGNRPPGVHFSGSGISEEDSEPDYSW